jgi:hypothetical protein
MKQIIKNKGTGAGGSQTTKNGGNFEKKVSMIPYLLKHGYKKDTDCIFKETDNNNYYYTEQAAAIKFCKTFGVDLSHKPDGLMVITNNNMVITRVIVIEVKNQNRSGSVDQKLWSSFGIRFSYMEDFNMDVDYAFIVSPYLWEKCIDKPRKAMRHLKKFLKKYNIPIVSSINDDYQDELYEFINLLEG